MPKKEIETPIGPGEHDHPHEGTDQDHGHTHHHPHTQTKLVLNRLSRITGHLEAIKRMVEQGRDCSEILVQLAAVDSAVMSVSKVILKDHLDHCIVDAIRENDATAIEDLKRALETFMK